MAWVRGQDPEAAVLEFDEELAEDAYEDNPDIEDDDEDTEEDYEGHAVEEDGCCA